MTATVASRYQVMRPLTDEEYADLKADVEQNGIAKPIDVDEDGNILDGHHRVRIAEELGIEFEARFITGLDEDGKREYARRVNSLGRQLSPDERRAEVAKLRSEGKTQREIADHLGVGLGTVNRDLSGLSDSNDVPDGTVADSGESDTRPEPPKSSEHECSECGLVMREPAWHCQGCNSHYPLGTLICAECNPPAEDLNEQEPVVPPEPTTKPKPRPGRPSRKPLPAQFFDAAHALTKATNKIAGIAADDRFPRNAEQVAAKHRNDLLRARDVLNDVIEQLPPEG